MSLNCGEFSLTIISCLGSWKGSGRRRTAFRTVKIAVLAPIPMASVSTAMNANPGLLTRLRIPKRTSCHKEFISAPLLAENTQEVGWRFRVFIERAWGGAGKLVSATHQLRGGMCERLKQAVLKTAIPERVSGVRIPL